MSDLVYIGIDPGDRWVGYAVLERRRGKWYATTAVIDMAETGFAETVETVTPETDCPTYFGIERYQSRNVGHQAFHESITAQLIGAIRYRVETAGDLYTLIEAADPDEDLPKFPIGPYVDQWRPIWPKPNSAHWHHARSAWRVLARTIMDFDHQLLIRFKRSPPPEFRFKDGKPASDGIILAPTAYWSAT